MTPDLQVLAAEKSMYGYTIKPWSLVQIAALSPNIERVVVSLKARKVNLATVMEGIKTRSFEGADAVIFSILPELPEIIAKTLKIDMAEVEKIPDGGALPIVLTIINQNVLYLKNWFGPLMDQAKEIVTGEAAI